MKNTIKLLSVVLIMAASVFTTKAQILSPYTPIPLDDEPSINEIIKKIEDTLNIKQGELKVGEVQKANQNAKDFTPRSKDADEQQGAIGNAEKAGSEVKSGQNAPDKLLKEAQKAAETVEKLTATATKELREKCG